MHAAYIRRVRGRGDRARTCNNRFWRPVLFQLSYAPMGIELCVQATKSPPCPPRAYGGLLVSEGFLPYMRPTCLPPKATEFCSVHWRFAGLCAASSALCPAYTGSVISMELKDRMVRLSFVCCSPGGEQPFRIHIPLDMSNFSVLGVSRVRSAFTKTYARRGQKARDTACRGSAMYPAAHRFWSPYGDRAPLAAAAARRARESIRCQTSARCTPYARRCSELERRAVALSHLAHIWRDLEAAPSGVVMVAAVVSAVLAEFHSTPQTFRRTRRLRRSMRLRVDGRG